MPNCSLEPTPTIWRQDLAAERGERLDLPAMVRFFERGFWVVGANLRCGKVARVGKAALLLCPVRQLLTIMKGRRDSVAMN